MLKFLLMGCMASCLYATAWSRQTPPVRYKDKVFTAVRLTKNVSYQNPSNTGARKKYGLLDLYEPAADHTLQRPLIIWMHGGGFKFGHKRSRSLPKWNRAFAQRGYVCASINYRLSKKHPLRSFPDLVKGCADGVEDVLQAIRFFKDRREQYRIDTNRIILAGHSAGGMIALHAVYSNANELASLADSTHTATTASAYNPGGVVAIINFWGAVFNTGWLRHASVPIVSVHGKKDRVVPYDHTNAGMYGSFAIHQKADSLHIPNRLKTYPRKGHELQAHFNPLWAGRGANKRYKEAGDFAAGFLYDQLFK